MLLKTCLLWTSVVSSDRGKVRMPLLQGTIIVFYLIKLKGFFEKCRWSERESFKWVA
jgi:hypothetical protein